HDVAGLLLRVDLTGVGDQGEHREVEGVVGAIVEVHELLAVIGQGGPFAARVHLLIDAGFGEARAGGGGGPEVGVVDGDVPAGRAAHAKAGDDDAVVIDLVFALGLVEN